MQFSHYNLNLANLYIYLNEINLYLFFPLRLNSGDLNIHFIILQNRGENMYCQVL